MVVEVSGTVELVVDVVDSVVVEAGSDVVVVDSVLVDPGSLVVVVPSSVVVVVPGSLVDVVDVLGRPDACHLQAATRQ